MEKEVVNEYNCSSCGKEPKVILTGHNNETIICPFCGSDDVQYFGSYDL